MLSYVLLDGRCRHCDARISPVYPLVEAVTAALIVACVAVFGPTPEAALASGFCAVLVTLSAARGGRYEDGGAARAVPLARRLVALFLGERILDSSVGVF